MHVSTYVLLSDENKKQKGFFIHSEYSEFVKPRNWPFNYTWREDTNINQTRETLLDRTEHKGH